MSQSNPAEREPDPLLAFFEECHAPRPLKPVELSAKEPDPPHDPLRRRIERAERQVERALIEITALKSDLATLVSAFEDIKKRMGRSAGQEETREPGAPTTGTSRRGVAMR